MDQMSFGDAEYAGKRKQTRREVFLAEMERVVPWVELLSLIEPHYPKAGRGRHPYPIATMLRVHLMQNWFGLSDPGMEEALYEITPMRNFARLRMTGAIPDETTILNFRRLLEVHELAPRILEVVNGHLSSKGLLLKRGTIVDATIISAPSSTKNATGERDPEMHQTKKGNQWYFGMKAHIGVDLESGLVHTVQTTPANAADVTEVANLLHGEESVVHADAGYTGASKRVEGSQITWHVAERRHKVLSIVDGPLRQAMQDLETLKARIRARVEHPFRVVKRQFGFQKVRFRGLAKNTAHVLTLFALSNLWQARRRLLLMTG
ncbi:MAG: IS5 family transposase [Xanthomonadales bacterium]|nr:IS5 family transposase [Xanthomonadales bacterium]MCB1642887.1 IS5 family transposase [Xanthomonadales bacterium]